MKIKIFMLAIVVAEIEIRSYSILAQIDNTYRDSYQMQQDSEEQIKINLNSEVKK